MPKFRKKPVEVEAIQFGGENFYEVMSWAKKRSTVFVGVAAGQETPVLTIDTLEGVMRADPGDWIICGVKQELYPCKPDIFEKTYDPA